MTAPATPCGRKEWASPSPVDDVDHLDRVISDIRVFCCVPTDAEITFADHMGRYYARRYAFPPMVGRLIGYLTVCDPRSRPSASWPRLC